MDRAELTSPMVSRVSGTQRLYKLNEEASCYVLPIEKTRGELEGKRGQKRHAPAFSLLFLVSSSWQLRLLPYPSTCRTSPLHLLIGAAVILWGWRELASALLLCVHFHLCPDSFISPVPIPYSLGTEDPSWDFSLGVPRFLLSSLSLRTPIFNNPLLKYPPFKMLSVLSIFYVVSSTGSVARKPLKMGLWNFRCNLDLELIVKFLFNGKWAGDNDIARSPVNHSSTSMGIWVQSPHRYPDLSMLNSLSWNGIKFASVFP